MESKLRYDITTQGDVIKATTDNALYQLPKMIKKLTVGIPCQTQILRHLKGTVMPQGENHNYTCIFQEKKGKQNKMSSENKKHIQQQIASHPVH